MIPPESRLTWTDIPTNQTWSIRAFLATSMTLAVGSIIGPLVGGSILRIIAQFARRNRQWWRVITMVFLVGYVTSAYTHLDASQITNPYLTRLSYFRVVLLADIHNVRDSVEPSGHLPPLHRLPAPVRQNGCRLVGCSVDRHHFHELERIAVSQQHFLLRGADGVLVLAARIFLRIQGSALLGMTRGRLDVSGLALPGFLRKMFG